MSGTEELHNTVSPEPNQARQTSRLFRILKIGLFLLGLAIVLVLAAGWWVFRSSLPETRGTLQLQGLSSKITVVRDSHGVPTITASNQDDAFFGLGFVHAQDRFYQLELHRHLGHGRLSELFGAHALDLDKFMRTLGMSKAARSAEPALRPDTQSILRAYAAGINAWLTSSGQALPAELMLLGVVNGVAKPEPWTPVDSLVWSKVMALSLSGNQRAELLRAAINEKVGAERAEQLFAPYPENAPVIVASAGRARAPSRAPSRVDPTDGVPLSADSLALLRLLPPSEGIGSNSWVVGPARSTSGYPILANDPHLGIENPSTWYMARIKAPGLDVSGMTLPGIPCVISGRNQRIAWGITNMMVDTQDLFLEQVDPRDQNRYLVGETSVPFEMRHEVIRVAGMPKPVEIDVKETRHGPVIKDDWNGHGPLALRWTALDAGDTTVQSFLDLNRAANWQDFRRALAQLVAPAQNFIYADVDKHIGYLGAGKIPIRSAGDGAVPVSGQDGHSEWTGFISIDDLPQTFDPKEGFIVTANNRVAGDSYPFLLTKEWSVPPYRAERIRQLILANPKLSLEDSVKMQSDLTSLLARDLVPLLLSTTVSNPVEKDALDRLKSWNLIESSDSGAGAIFAAWCGRLVSALYRDELGDALQGEYGLHPRELISALTDKTEWWCDDHTTSERESCADILHRSLKEALDILTKKLGPDSSKWRLGNLLTTRFENQVGSNVPVLGALFTRTLKMGGDSSTVRVNHYSLYDFSVNALSSFFSDADLVPGRDPLFVETLGQSDHPLSSHFDDQFSEWSNTQPFPLSLDTTTMGETLILQPHRDR